MKKLYVFLMILVTFTTLSCKKGSDKVVEKVFFSMDTAVVLSVEEKDFKKTDKVVEYVSKLEEEIVNDQKNINNSNLNQAIKVTDTFIEVFNRAIKYSEISEYIYDPTSITVAKLYGFPSGKFQVPDNSSLINAKKEAGKKNIVLKNNEIYRKTFANIDLSANAKGYIVDKTVEYMKKKGFKNFIVNAGGDLYTYGKKYSESPYKIAIEDPDNDKGFISIIKLSNKAVATSGNYERFFIAKDGRRITHFFNGINFESVNNYKSISVISDSVEMADGLATMYYLLKVEDINKICTKYKTPVLIATLDNKHLKMCGWEEFEE